MKLLNLACGSRFHSDWINLDFHPASRDVVYANLTKKLPFDDGSFDVVYHSHFLEHLPKSMGVLFLSENYRILRNGGILRVVVPDLEEICKTYIQVLESAKKSYQNTELKKYNFLVLELIDQMVRTYPGGLLLDEYKRIIKESDVILREYASERTGEQFIGANLLTNKNNLYSRVKNKLIYSWINLVSYLLPSSIRYSVINHSTIGERHMWMYDELQLRQMLESIGFSNVRKMNFDKSIIPEYNKYGLDMRSDGRPYKGTESLYIEAVKQ